MYLIKNNTVGVTIERNVPWLVSSFLRKFFGSTQPTYTQMKNALMGNNILEVNLSSASNSDIPATCNHSNPHSDSEHIELNMNIGRSTI